MPSGHSAPKAGPAVGLDFGTTNSSVAAIATDGSVRMARFPVGGSATASFRSLLYFDRDARRQVHSYAGPSAIDRYLSTAEREDPPGRLVQSLKSYLPSRTLTGTEVFGRRYSLEDLLAKILRELRIGAEASLDCALQRAVVGRPVRFVGAETTEDEAFALDRLREACHRAGFLQVHFEYEPVGAACAYESTLDHQELVLIGDFGGGTSDFSLLRVGPGMQTQQRVLGTSGVGLAGDAFDAKLVRHLVSPALGMDSLERSGKKFLPAVPAWIYANLERWHYLSFLRTRNVTEILKGARVRALEPEKIYALQLLIEHDFGSQLHASVQQLKYALSQQPQAQFQFDALDSDLHLRIPVSRLQFEGWIEEELQAIAQAVDSLMAKTGIAPPAGRPRLPYRRHFICTCGRTHLHQPLSSTAHRAWRGLHCRRPRPGPAGAAVVLDVACLPVPASLYLDLLSVPKDLLLALASKQARACGIATSPASIL